MVSLAALWCSFKESSFPCNPVICNCFGKCCIFLYFVVVSELLRCSFI